jgi:type II secretory pathway component GspD/PulD (secretin)
MSHPGAVRRIALSLIVFGCAAAAAHAQDERAYVPLKHANAKELAATLTQHFKGVAGMQVIAETGSNGLLISGPKDTVRQVFALLAELDRSPRVIAIDIFLLDVTLKKDQTEFDTKPLNGPLADVEKRIAELRKDGTLTGSRRIQLSGVENQKTYLQVGETKPMVMGVSASKIGGTSQMIQYRNTGTIVDLTPRVAPDGVVLLTIKVEESRLHTPDSGPVIGTTEKGPIYASETVMSNLNSQMSLHPGQALVATGVKTDSKQQNVQTVIVVAARVIEGK